MIVNDCKFTKNKISRLKLSLNQNSCLRSTFRIVASITGITTQCEQALSLCQH